jgi:DNA mismatch endonuclease (patch repair protein)
MANLSDCFSQDVRSKVMASVKSTGNKSTELKLISIFKKHSISGWRRHINIVGHPDFVFANSKVVVFADGCFWHGHNCRNTIPKTNKSFWDNKLYRNIQRDKKNNRLLKNTGWLVFRFWECEINSTRYQRKLNKLINVLKK